MGLVGEGDGWRQWPMGHSLQAPLGRGPSRPLGGCAVGARGAGFTDRVSHQPCAPAQFGGSAVRSQEAPRGVRKETLEGCSPPLTSPPPSCSLEGNEDSACPGPKALLDEACQLLLSLQPKVLPAAPRWSSGRRTDGQVPLHSSSLLLGDWGRWPGRAPSRGESPRARGTGGCGWWFTGGTFFEAPSLCSLSLLSPASLPPQPSLSAPNDPLPWGDS